VELNVAGVWRDYSRQTGAIMINLDDYRRLTGDRLINDAAIDLAPGANADQVAAALTAMAGPGVLEIARPGEIRALSLRIFDRTFAVTYLLEAVAIAIGLAGVAASFAALASARRREFGMLRHLGLTRRQIGWMLAQEGALAAGVGVLAGLAGGGRDWPGVDRSGQSPKLSLEHGFACALGVAGLVRDGVDSAGRLGRCPRRPSGHASGCGAGST
jgi:putative ABC transport system permease protein